MSIGTKLANGAAISVIVIAAGSLLAVQMATPDWRAKVAKTSIKQKQLFATVNPLFNEVELVNKGSTIQIKNVIINNREECTSGRDPSHVLGDLMQREQSRIENMKMLGWTPPKFWRTDDVLQLGETSTIMNLCQGQILQVELNTDQGPLEITF